MPSERDSGARPGAVATPPPSVERRVQIIAEEMEGGTWGPAKARDLASRWGLALTTVRDASAEASRSLRFLEREAARARVEALYDKAGKEARGATEILRVAESLARFYGLDRGQTSGGSGQPEPTTTPGERPPPPPGHEEVPDAGDANPR